MGYFIRLKGRQKIWTASDTAGTDDFSKYGVWLLNKGSGFTITLPTASKTLSKDAVLVGNIGAGTGTFSGAFVGGATTVGLATRESFILFCVETTPGLYKWAAVGPGTASIGDWLPITTADITDFAADVVTAAAGILPITPGDVTGFDGETLVAIQAALAAGTTTGATIAVDPTGGTIDVDVNAPDYFSSDEEASIHGANGPTAANPMATMADLPADELSSDELASIQGAATPSAINVMATMADLPAAELDADELASIQGAAAPTALNPMATMADIPVVPASGYMTSDQEAAMDAANTPTALNPVATIADCPTGAELDAMSKFHRVGYTGGGGTKLDGIAIASLTDGDVAVVDVGGLLRSYHLWIAADVNAESSPDYIAADDNGADPGRWALIKFAKAAIEDLATADLTDYTATMPWDPTIYITWATATPDAMTLKGEVKFIGAEAYWRVYIVSADPGNAVGSIATMGFPPTWQPAKTDMFYNVTGVHRKDFGAGDTQTAMIARLDATAALVANRIVTFKNAVVWADNEDTDLFFEGYHAIA